MMRTNNVEITGRLNRMDLRFGVAKTGNEFVSATFTLQVGESQIKVENFSMRYKKDGEELASYKGLMTLFAECKALHKTFKRADEDMATEVTEKMSYRELYNLPGRSTPQELIRDDAERKREGEEHLSTIVKDINECDAVRFSNYGNFKYCRLEENSYAKDGEIVKNLRLVGASPNRVDESKKEYVPTADFEVAGVVMTAPMLSEKDEVEFMQFKVMIPIYTEAWGDREAKVDLVEMTVRLNDESAFGYVEDEFTVGAFVSLNGTIVREVKRVELEVPMENEGRGFGRQIEHKAQYKTEIVEYYNLLGGYTLEEEEVENTPALNMDLWNRAKEEKAQKEQEMLQQNDKPRQGFGRGEQKVETKQKPVLPF